MYHLFLKKGDLKIAGNYHTVSLASITCKLFEHIISSNVIRNLEGNDILDRLQHGFRKYKSCETQLISLLYDLACSLDQRIQTYYFT